MERHSLPLIYSSLNLPATSALPSLSCLQWSGDGQLFFVSKESVYILTPNHTADVKAPGNARNTHDKPLGWFKTMIEMEKKDIHQWTTSQEWGTAVFGSRDIKLRTIAISPSNLTKDAGCVACLLTSNLDLSLWAPDRNRVRGKWTKIQDVLPILQTFRSRGQVHPTTGRTLQAQTTSIAWSPQAGFDVVPAPALDASLLAVGTRAGVLFILRYHHQSEKLVCVDKVKIAKNGLTHLAFSRWSPARQGKCDACLAYGTSDGGVALITLTQSLNSTPSSSSGFGPIYSLEPGIENYGLTVMEPDKRTLTGLKWLDCKDNAILVICKPGLILLWTASTSTLPWSGLRSLTLQPQPHAQKHSVGASPFQSISGLHYVSHEDILMISLFDGSIRVIYDLSSDPSWTPIIGNHTLTSQTLSRNARVVFSRTEPGKIKRTDVNCISGLLPFDGHATLLWTHESCQPSNLDYAYDSQHHIMLVATQLWKPCAETILHELETTLTSSKTTSGVTPLHLLRSCFLYLVDHPEIHSDVARLLNDSFPTQLNSSFDEMPSSMMKLSLRQDFRRSLSEHFFGSDALLRLRMKLSVADKILSVTLDPLIRSECEQIAYKLFQKISQSVLRILIRHLIPIAAMLTVEDSPFALRVTSQSSLPSCPPDLYKEAKNLTDLIYATVPLTYSQRLSLESDTEKCPACSSEIHLESGAFATCSKGHTWGRCSITSFILTTGMVRQCTGCGRKAFLPPSCSTNTNAKTWLPASGQSWVVEELLEAVLRCLFCGNSFVDVI